MRQPPRGGTHIYQLTATFLHDTGGELMEDAAAKLGADIRTGTYERMVAEGRDEYPRLF